jgi:hypothetical protein
VIADWLALLIVAAIAAQSIFRRGIKTPSNYHHPTIYVFLEFMLLGVFIYYVWDYKGADFGESFYFWLFMKDCLFALFLIAAFRNWSIGVLAVFYILSSVMNGVFYCNELHYSGLVSYAEQIKYYDTYISIYNSYGALVYFTVSGQIVGLLIHDGGGIYRSIRVITDFFSTNDRKSNSANNKVTGCISRVKAK